MKKKLIYLFFIFFIALDLSYSFVQHASMPLDGDMPGGIVPANDVKPLLSDPFGVSVISKNALYPNPNRFFAHWTFKTYFTYTPIFLQIVFDPVDSVYWSAAISKIIIQILLISLLGFYISGKTRIASRDFILAAVLITPLFQTNGYRSYMGIIDPSVTYTFFYALPITLLLLFYLPFYLMSISNGNFRIPIIIKILLVCLAVFITLNGPLIPGIVITISIVYFNANYFHGVTTGSSLAHFQSKMFPFAKYSRQILFFFSVITLFSAYSLYIGKNNPIFLNEHVTLAERYLRIPMGVYYLFSQKIGLPLLALFIGVNTYLIRRYAHDSESREILTLFKWIGLFSILYVILLPMGGYKNYRPYILRYDTFMPITIAMIFMYGRSSLYLIRYNQEGLKKKIYITSIIAVSLIFTFADQPGFDKNGCEKSVLETIARSKESTIVLESNCPVLSWGKITDPSQSELIGKLLVKWRITSEEKLFYQK